MKETILSFNLRGGLCNKLYCLFSACEIALKNNSKMLEPIFSWEKKGIPFSDIYDVDYFNDNMRNFNKGKDLMVKLEDKCKYNVIRFKEVSLFAYSNRVLDVQRKVSKMKKKCMALLVMKALLLNKKNLTIVNSFNNIENEVAVHFRIESDWIDYNKRKKAVVKKRFNPKECILIDKNKLINMIKTKYPDDKIYFTTGENHNDLQKTLLNLGIKSNYYYNNNFSYDLNAAINFALCSKAKIFVGLSRSTFSNLITLKRTIDLKEESYIYNFGESIFKRNDAGLHCNAYKAINNTTQFV